MEKGLSTQAAIQLLEEIQRYLELKGENPFKIRAYEKAAHAIAEFEDLSERAESGTLTEIPGVGKGIAEVLTEFYSTGQSSMRDELRDSLPAGFLELTEIPGLGPKKAMKLIEELEIHSIRELEYACRENRLLSLKGFGIKQQAKILEGIEFLDSHRGMRRLGDVYRGAQEFLKTLEEVVSEYSSERKLRVSETGELRRRVEVLTELQFVVELPTGTDKASKLQEKLSRVLAKWKKDSSLGIEAQIFYAQTARFGFLLAHQTASRAHWEAIGAPEPFDCDTEEVFYEKLGLPCFPPEARETGEEVKLAKAGKWNPLLPWNGIRGVFHNHTHRSDGDASLEEMVVRAKAMGFEYIGISDHSQSAFYASGLTKDVLKQQEKEVREVQDRHPEIRIFWGIESDILADGSLDYDESVLKRFDFVIGSVHSRFKMDREAMTDRILEAIRHPCTRFLGHATGRLLLGRKGYELDMERVIQEAAKRNVAIEINANPARLDIDWRWGPQLRACGTQVSVNPDAHDVEGLEDTEYGVAMARKALLTPASVVNSRSAADVEAWLKREGA